MMKKIAWNVNLMSSDEGELEEDSSDESDEDEDDSAPTKRLITGLDNEPSESGGLSKRAKSFFSQDIFKDIPGILDEPEPEADDVDEEMVDAEEEETRVKESKPVSSKEPKKKTPKQKIAAAAEEQPSDSESDHKKGFDIARRKKDDVDAWEDEDKRKPDGTYDIDIITAEAMTLAHQLATGEKTKYDVMDEGFNKYAFKDRDGMPEWFLDDEGRHDRPQKPITKAAAAAIKEKTRALNARPIKKVREAKARKKFKTAQRLEKLKKKSDVLAADEAMTEKEKADSIQRLMAKAAGGNKKARPQPKLVVARGLNRGIKGRPKGVKGRYKIVDPRMKKELRAQKRIAKK
ncbi:putative et-dependent rrna methyltransferase spb1 protein [Eutypa lata UCREL1]|uniref:Putative et-dependent rrna methyltransferase spb1 protein n=1 Tax=Eutypa lata (strain UCR-EL1) TaxID=1287681 RepID=M7T740_EUTLA|nr:putative et-dependent rrna methyltransferase spb1 protein [Eutypa lata UCREL1]